MVVYVDTFRVPAAVGRTRGRWSHLTADTPDELHAFAARIGLQRRWYQERCKHRCAPEGAPCPHWHYDVTESRRAAAIRLGAMVIDFRDMGALCGARRRREPWPGPTRPVHELGGFPHAYVDGCGDRCDNTACPAGADHPVCVPACTAAEGGDSLLGDEAAAAVSRALATGYVDPVDHDD